MQVDVDIRFGLDAKLADATIEELRQALADLEIAASVVIEQLSNH